MSLVVTGATGHLGRLVVDNLLAQGVRAGEIVATGRRVDALDDLAARGVRVAPIDYAHPETLSAAFAGADKVLFVSGSEVGQRTAQHRHVVDAARATGVGLVAYTSIAHADTSTMLLAAEHLATERALRDAGVPFVLLRNSWYLENYTEQLRSIVTSGLVVGSAGAGRVSAATRADYAAAAATVLTTDGHEGAVYELGGDNAFTLAELADEIARHAGTEVVYRDLPTDEHERTLVGLGIPEAFAALLADSDRGIANNELFVDTGDLRHLAGRPTTSLAQAIAAAFTLA